MINCIPFLFEDPVFLYTSQLAKTASVYRARTFDKETRNIAITAQIEYVKMPKAITINSERTG